MRKILSSLLMSLVMAGAGFAADGKQLFNGQSLSGWEHVGPGRFTVEPDGTLKTNGGMGLLWYANEKVGNSVLRIVYKVTHPESNSGVFIRIADKPKDEWYAVHNGYEVQILDQGPDDWHQTGAIYSLSKASKNAARPVGQWNTLDIRLEGQRTVVSLNGEVINEFRGGQAVPERQHWYEPERGPRPDAGYIGLQNHDEKSTVYFKEISVHPLK